MLKEVQGWLQQDFNRKNLCVVQVETRNHTQSHTAVHVITACLFCALRQVLF